MVGVEVQSKKQIDLDEPRGIGEITVDTRLWIVKVSARGIEVATTPGATSGFNVNFGTLKLSEYVAPNKEKEAKRVMPPMPAGVGFQLANLEQSKEMVRCMVVSGLYKLQTSCGSGPTQLRICSVEEKPILYANATARANALVRIQFSTYLRHGSMCKDSSEVHPEAAVQIKCRIEMQARVHRFHCWACEWEAPVVERTMVDDAPAAVATCWYTRRCAAIDGGVKLSLETCEVNLNLSTSCDGGPLRKGGPKANIIMEVPYPTNDGDVLDGERLFVGAK